jgi:hypothetical protein
MDDLSDDDSWDDYWTLDKNGNPHYTYKTVDGIDCAFWPYHNDTTFLLSYNNVMYNVVETDTQFEVHNLSNVLVGIFQYGEIVFIN